MKDGLSPAFVREEGPETGSDGVRERAGLNPQTQQLEAGTVQLSVLWARDPGRSLGQLERERERWGYVHVFIYLLVKGACMDKYTLYISIFTGIRDIYLVL